MYKILVLLLLYNWIDCQELLDNSRCNHWPDRGECEGTLHFDIQWYYDRYDHRCRKFFYGGCGGNENRFETLEECSSSCTFHDKTTRDRCMQEHNPGTCNSDIERWFFDMHKKQCVCSWWSGCGGNSNIYYSYNHCMLICGEFAEHGPGIDEEYWGKRNGTFSEETRQVISHPPTEFLRVQYVESDNHYQPPEITDTVKNFESVMAAENEKAERDARRTINVESQPSDGLDTLDVPARRPYPIVTESNHNYGLVHVQPIPFNVEQKASGDVWTPSISWREYQDGSINPTLNTAEYRQKAELVAFQGGRWENTTDDRTLGAKTYRYDSGPLPMTNPDGTVTMNRQVLVIMENHVPRMNYYQRVPGLVEFTRVTPPAPISTMMSPIIRRRIKKIQKTKIPPRIINPDLQSVQSSRVQSSQDNQYAMPMTPVETSIRQKITWNGPLPTVTLDQTTSNQYNRYNDLRHQDTAPTQLIGQANFNEYPRQLNNPRNQAATQRSYPQLHEQSPPPAPTRAPLRNQNPTVSYPQQIRQTEYRTQAYPVWTQTPPTAATTQRTSRRPDVPPTYWSTQGYQYNRPTIPSVVLPHTTFRPTQPTRRDHFTTFPAPTAQRATMPPKQIYVRPPIIDAATVLTPTIPPTKRVEAEPIMFNRPIIEKQTITPQPKMSIEDIIALDAGSYDDYDTDMQMEPDDEIPTKSSRTRPTTAARPPPPTQRVVQHSTQSTSFMPIVFPIGNDPAMRTENVDEFEIQAVDNNFL